MSSYDHWKQLTENQTEKSYKKFWDEYSAAEIKIYSDILGNKTGLMEGAFSELVAKYDVSETMFMGFLDGINTSLTTPLDLDGINADTTLALNIDFKKLYQNMLAANAEHLYTLPEWDGLIDQAEREDIATAYKKSKTVIKEKLPNRNDPCLCGSGKKYKKCCGV